MKLEDHVPSIELCRKWEELGGRQDTIFEWFEYVWTSGKKTWLVYPSIECHPGENCIAAPLASELMDWYEGEYILQVMKYPDKYYTVALFDVKGNKIGLNLMGKNVSDLIMKMIIKEKMAKEG